MPDLIGRRLGQYLILEQIGKGGMATVYKAEQTSLDRIVAIKLLPSYFMHDETFRERFVQEARAVARLKHPHILPVYDFGDSEDATYIVMEYVEGGTLQTKTGQPVPFAYALKIVEQIASALDYAHARKIVHRDIKPSNIMLREDGETALLADFGLAKMTESARALTRSGVGVGTPEYMSPEQGQGALVDWRTDLYSLGVVLYELLTGHIPYEAETPLAVVIKHISEPLPHARILNPALPEAIDNVMLMALAKNPAERFQKGADLTATLRRIEQDSSKPASAPTVARPSQSQMRMTPPPPLTATGGTAIAGQPPSGGTSPVTVETTALTPPVVTTPTHEGGRTKRSLLLVGLVALALVIVSAIGGYALFANPAQPTPTTIAAVALTTATTTPSPTPSPTETKAATSTSTLSPTATAPATSTATPTAIPPTETAVPVVVPPTDTPTRRPPTNTPVPPPPTDTPAPVLPQFSGILAVPICSTPCSERSQQIVLFKPDGTKLRAIGQATDPSFQQDGKRIIFRSLAASGTAGNRSEGIFYFDFGSGRDDQIVTHSPKDGYPVFMSGKVLFASTRDFTTERRLFSVSSYGNEASTHNGSGSDDSPYTIGPDFTTLLRDASWPSFSEATGLIAYKGCNGPGCGIWTAGEGGYAINRACCQIAKGGSDSAPDWSPDGQRLAFISREDGPTEIYTTNLNGSGRRRLTNSGGSNLAPTWSPDGQWIAYLSDRSGGWAVWVMKPDGSGNTKLFDLNASLSDPLNRRMDWGP